MAVELSLSTALQIGFCVALMFIILTGNSFVVLAYFSNFSLRTGTYTFLISLAISDLLVGCVSLPLYMYISLKHIQRGPLNTFFLSFDIFSALASIFHLTAVSLERWLAISRPFVHETLSAKHYSLAISGVWMTALAIAAIRPAMDQSSSSNPHKIYTPFLLLVGYVGPGILISFVNYSIFKVARGLIANLPTIQSVEENIKLRKNINKQRRTALTLTFVTALFLVSWLSFFVMSTISVFCTQCVSIQNIGAFLIFAKWLQYCNSSMNPLVYAFRDTEMRKTFLRLLRPCRRALATPRRWRVAPIDTSLEQGTIRFRDDNKTTMEVESQL